MPPLLLPPPRLSRPTPTKALDALAEQAHAERRSIAADMVAGIAHELSQPLSLVLSYADACLQALHDQPRDSALLERDLTRVVAQARRAADIVNRLRGFVRRSTPTLRPVNLRELVADVLVLMAGDARRARVRTIADIPESLPSVLADSVYLSQIFVNLVRNALEAITHAEAATREVTLSARVVAAHKVEVTVRDTGPGVPPTLADRIFESYFTTKPQGLGVGLALSRALAGALGGRLEVNEADDNGASFQLTLLTATRAHHPRAEREPTET